MSNLPKKRGRGRPLEGDPELTTHQRYEQKRSATVVGAIKRSPAEAEQYGPALDVLEAHYGGRQAGVLAAVLAHAAELTQKG